MRNPIDCDAAETYCEHLLMDPLGYSGEALRHIVDTIVFMMPQAGIHTISVKAGTMHP